MRVQRLVLMMGAVFLAGCGSLATQLKKHSENVARCDKLLAEPDLPDWKIDENYLLERAGFVGKSCTLKVLSIDGVQRSHWQAICELDKIAHRHQTTYKDQKKIDNITLGYKDLTKEVKRLNDRCVKELPTPDNKSNTSRAIRKFSVCLNKRVDEKGEPTDLDNIFEHAEKISQAVEQLQADTFPAEVQKDLQLWSATVKSSLQKLQSPATFARDAIVNLSQSHAVTHVAQQSYRRLKKTTALGDKGIDRLDEKTSGALSIGNLFFSETLSDELAQTISPTLIEFQKQHPDDPLASVGMFTRAVARAACENQDKGQDSGLLQNLLDSTLIRLADSASTPPASTAPIVIDSKKPIQQMHPDYIVPSYAPSIVQQAKREPIVTDFSPQYQDKPASTNSNDQTQAKNKNVDDNGKNPPDLSTSIHSIYAGYEWQARRYLLQQQQDKLNNYKTPLSLPNEASVQELAKAAAAQQITPEFLEALAPASTNLTYALPIQNTAPGLIPVYINRSAQDAAQIAASQNAAKPDIHIHYTPPAPPPKPLALPDLCSALRKDDVDCRQVGDQYLLQPYGGFESAKYTAAKMDATLNRISGIIQSYTLQNPAGYRANVTGYASHYAAERLCLVTHPTWSKNIDDAIELEPSTSSVNSAKLIRRISTGSTTHSLNDMSSSFDKLKPKTNSVINYL